MTTRLKKTIAAVGLLSASAAVMAANTCCGDLACCLERLASCCF